MTVYVTIPGAHTSARVVDAPEGGYAVQFAWAEASRWLYLTGWGARDRGRRIYSNRAAAERIARWYVRLADRAM